MSEFNYIRVDPEHNDGLEQLCTLLREGWKILSTSSYEVRWTEMVIDQYVKKEQSRILYILTRNPIAKSLYGP